MHANCSAHPLTWTPNILLSILFCSPNLYALQDLGVFKIILNPFDFHRERGHPCVAVAIAATEETNFFCRLALWRNSGSSLPIDDFKFIEALPAKATQVTCDWALRLKFRTHPSGVCVHYVCIKKQTFGQWPIAALLLFCMVCIKKCKMLNLVYLSALYLKQGFAVF
jgi:hypothetical protein